MKGNDEEGYQWLLCMTVSAWPSSSRGGGGVRRVRSGGAQRHGWDRIHRGARQGPPRRVEQGCLMGSSEGTSMGRSSTDPWMESSPRAFMERERS
jgi:hypothetical protein